MPRASCPGGLVAHGLVKRFGGRVVVRGVSLRVEPGSVYALVGPNGAGKTTTVRMLVGLYQPDEGEVSVCGRPVGEAGGLVAYLPENAGVYPRLTGFEHIRFYVGLYLGRHDPRVVEEAARITGLSREDLGRRVGEYSRGMRRRLLLGIVLALGTPVVVLDEPTSGLDVESSVRVRRLIRRAADGGRAVLFTSHNMLEVERISDRVGFISDGRIVAEGSPRELVERFGGGDLEEAFLNAVKAVDDNQR